MQADLIPPPVPSTRLSHLRPGEVRLYRRFEELNPLPSPRYKFDLHLGHGMTTDPTWPRWVRAMAQRLTQRRVDVLASTPVGWWIIEIKVRAGPSAVGQLLTYRTLFRAQYPDREPVHLAIVADRNSTDMVDVYTRFGITLVLV